MGRAFRTGVVAPVPTCPAVVPSGVVEGGGRYDAALSVQIFDHARKFGIVLEGHNKFCVVRNNSGGEGDVCRSESRNRSAITSRNGDEVGDGVHRFLLVKVLLVKVIIRLEPGTGGSDLIFAPFLVCVREEVFKSRPFLLAADRRLQVLQSSRKRPFWKTS